jgi:hypothetical protein
MMAADDDFGALSLDGGQGSLFLSGDRTFVAQEAKLGLEKFNPAPIGASNQYLHDKVLL